MNIRPYKKGDESQIVWLINNTWKTAYSHIFPSEVFEERERNINERISVFGENLEKFERICFVAEENSKIVGVLVGILISFTLNLKFNFKVNDCIFRRFCLFFSIGLLGLLLSTGIIALGEKLNWDIFITKIISIFVVAILQFILNKFISFKRNK